MIHLLPPDPPAINDCSEAINATLLAREPGRHGHDPAEERLMAHVAIGERGDVLFRDDHEVDGRERMDVVEGEDFVVLVDLAARDFAAHDAAEDAVGGHGVSRMNSSEP